MASSETVTWVSSAIARTRLRACAFADGEVVHASGAAEAHLAGGVEAVVAQAVVLLGAWAGGCGLRGGPVGLAGGAAGQGAVGALLVVVVAELVELALQLGECSGGRSGAQPALQGLVEALDLALGLRVSGCAVLLLDAEEREEVFEGVAAAAEAGGVDAAVVGQRARWRAVIVDHGKECWRRRHRR